MKSKEKSKKIPYTDDFDRNEIIKYSCMCAKEKINFLKRCFSLLRKPYFRMNDIIKHRKFYPSEFSKLNSFVYEVQTNLIAAHNIDFPSFNNIINDVNRCVDIYYEYKNSKRNLSCNIHLVSKSYSIAYLEDIRVNLHQYKINLCRLQKFLAQYTLLNDNELLHYLYKNYDLINIFSDINSVISEANLCLTSAQNESDKIFEVTLNSLRLLLLDINVMLNNSELELDQLIKRVNQIIQIKFKKDIYGRVMDSHNEFTDIINSWAIKNKIGFLLEYDVNLIGKNSALIYLIELSNRKVSIHEIDILTFRIFQFLLTDDLKYFYQNVILFYEDYKVKEIKVSQNKNNFLYRAKIDPCWNGSFTNGIKILYKKYKFLNNTIKNRADSLYQCLIKSFKRAYPDINLQILENELKNKIINDAELTLSKILEDWNEISQNIKQVNALKKYAVLLRYLFIEFREKCPKVVEQTQVIPLLNKLQILLNINIISHTMLNINYVFILKKINKLAYDFNEVHSADNQFSYTKSLTILFRHINRFIMREIKFKDSLRKSILIKDNLIHLDRSFAPELLIINSIDLKLKIYNKLIQTLKYNVLHRKEDSPFVDSVCSTIASISDDLREIKEILLSENKSFPN